MKNSSMRVGITGHRTLAKGPRAATFVYDECIAILELLQQLARRLGTTVTALSGLAKGADQLFARAALDLGLSVVAILAFEGYPNSKSEEITELPRQEQPLDFDSLLALCCETQQLGGPQTEESYMRVGEMLVDQSDYLVAVWDGKPQRKGTTGGTADVVRYAKSKAVPILHINPNKIPAKQRHA